MYDLFFTRLLLVTLGTHPPAEPGTANAFSGQGPRPMVPGLLRAGSRGHPPPSAADSLRRSPLIPDVIVVFIVLLLLSANAKAEVCPSDPKATVDIVAVHNPPTLHTEFNRKQLSDISRSTHRIGRHEPLGFYFGKFGYTIDIRLSPTGMDCPETITITLTMGLFDRQVEVARDLPAGKCLYRTAVSHYRRHAQADDVIFSRYTRLVAQALPAVPTRQIAGANPSPADIENIKLNTASIVEKTLSSFNDDRDAAQAMVDTPAEVNRLAHAVRSIDCTRAVLDG